MIERFENDEAGYLQWVHAHPDGYVANVDKRRSYKQYPMVHRATHKVISTPTRENYTTNEFIKFCSTDLSVLERWSLDEYNKPLNHCGGCM